MKLKTIFILMVLLIAIVTLIAWGAVRQNTPSKLDGFAQCLKDKGAVFYGAFWCSHCQDQKKIFGTAKRLLPYVECSTPDGNRQTQVCIDKKISVYPTWQFGIASSSTLVTGLLDLSQLAEKTGCALPVEK